MKLHIWTNANRSARSDNNRTDKIHSQRPREEVAHFYNYLDEKDMRIQKRMKIAIRLTLVLTNSNDQTVSCFHQIPDLTLLYTANTEMAASFEHWGQRSWWRKNQIRKLKLRPLVHSQTNIYYGHHNIYDWYVGMCLAFVMQNNICLHFERLERENLKIWEFPFANKHTTVLFLQNTQEVSSSRLCVITHVTRVI